MNIFAVGLVTGGDVKETSKSHVEGSVADCKDTGIKEHWITDFGMYYSDAQLTTALSPTETILDKTDNHNFVGGTCTVCGKDENAAVTEVNFAKLAGSVTVTVRVVPLIDKPLSVAVFFHFAVPGVVTVNHVVPKFKPFVNAAPFA